jgi:hypothetical protein
MVKEKIQAPVRNEVHVWQRRYRGKPRWQGRRVFVTRDGGVVKIAPLGRTYANVQAVRRAAKAKWPTLAKRVVTLTKAA